MISLGVSPAAVALALAAAPIASSIGADDTAPLGAKIADAREATVAGTVIDGDTGEAISGVHVAVEGTGIGAFTDDQGEYTLSDVPAGEQRVRAEFMGYAPVEETVVLEAGDSVTLDFELQRDALALDEVVAVGYGERRREGVTGNIARVGREEIETLSVTSLEEAIQGRAAGVHMISGSGKTGQAVRTHVRGPASLSASNQPLYVVDGVPVTSESQTVGGDPTNPIADLNPRDIESVEILKDASAAAIYGSRGSNGVVLITTRQGAAGDSRFELGYTAGWSEPTNTVNFVTDPDLYREMALEAAENVGWGEEELRNWVPFWDNPVPTDWQDAAFRDGAGMQQTNLSVSGGTAGTQYYLSIGHHDERGILIRDAFERTSGRLNLDHHYSDALTVGMNVSLGRTVNDRMPGDRAWTQPMFLVSQSPLSPAYDPETGEVNRNTLYVNPLLAKDDMWEQVVWRTLGSAYADYDLRANLSFRSSFGTDLLNQKEEWFSGRQTTPSGQGFFRSLFLLNYNTDHYLTYRPGFLGPQHDVETVVGTSYQRAEREAASVTGEDFPTDQFQRIASAATLTGGMSEGDGYSFLSMFSRVHYDYDSRYFLSLSGRMDGSSRFGADNRYGFFPAGSAGWIVTNEDFWDRARISFLRLRGSYGLTGNSGVGNFAARGLFTGADYVGQSGIRPYQLRNPDLQWETTAELNLGVEMGLFEDRVSAEVDVYHRRTRDLLLMSPVPGTSGFESVMQNVGAMRNRGIELLVNSENMVGEFTWSTTLNFDLNRNTVTDLDGEIIDTGAGTGAQRRPNFAMEGEPLGVFYAPRFAGADPETGDALFYKRAGSDETTANFDEAERQIIGSPHPDFTASLTNRFTWRNFALDGTVYVVWGQDRYSGGGIFYENNQQWLDPQIESQLDRWQEPGDETDVPELRLFQTNGSQISSRYLHDASFVRLRNVNLAYDVPGEWLARVPGLGGDQEARLYVRGTNLLTLTDYPLWDPEVDTHDGSELDNLSYGNDFYTPPQARTVAIGVDLTF